MGDILKEILEQLPANKISNASFEGANIVLYTKDKDFFLDNRGLIKKVVDSIKKRVELRPDPELCMEQEKAEKEIKKIIPEETEIGNVNFEPQQSVVIIEAEKPGLVIGKQGNYLQKIKEKTMWVPQIKRKPVLRSQLIENIRAVLYQNNDSRKKFLDKVGHRIYDGWLTGKKEEWVRVSYLGAGRQVGRSCLLLQTPESNIVMDCGLDPAVPMTKEGNQDAYPFFRAPEFNIEKIDAVIVTHAHTDHSALVPLLFKMGYRGPVYCTAPTRDIMSLLQLDTVKIARNEGRDPLYTSDDVKEMVKHTITLNYDEVTDVTPDIRLTLHNAGHILGSAMAHINVGNGLHNLLYGADMKYGKTELLNPAFTKFTRLETLMVESTYGGKDCVPKTRGELEADTIEIITKTIKRGGKVLIPSLGVGRSQEIMLVIESLVRSGRLNEIPVYIDGMVWDVTAIHTAYPEYLNNNIRKLIFHRDHNPFLSPIFKRVGSAKERQQIVEEGGPCVIIATSGMLMGGPSVEYLKQLSDDKRNTLMFVCYQGASSLGRRIQRGEREFMQPGKNSKQDIFKINMEVTEVQGFGGHSNRNELMKFVQNVSPRPRKVIVNHGESSRCLDLASSIHKTFRIETSCPRNLETIRLK